MRVSTEHVEAFLHPILTEIPKPRRDRGSRDIRPMALGHRDDPYIALGALRCEHLRDLLPDAHQVLRQRPKHHSQRRYPASARNNRHGAPMRINGCPGGRQGTIGVSPARGSSGRNTPVPPRSA